MAIYRLRKRFRDLVKSEIGHTVDRMTTVDEELRHLIEALDRDPGAESSHPGVRSV